MCVFFLLSSQLRLSVMSVVFDFNDSLNDVALVSPISFPIEKTPNPLTRLHRDLNYGVVFLMPDCPN